MDYAKNHVPARLVTNYRSRGMIGTCGHAGLARPRDTLLFHVHGGGFIAQSPLSHIGKISNILQQSSIFLYTGSPKKCSYVVRMVETLEHILGHSVYFTLQNYLRKPINTKLILFIKLNSISQVTITILTRASL